METFRVSSSLEVIAEHIKKHEYVCTHSTEKSQTIVNKPLDNKKTPNKPSISKKSENEIEEKKNPK